MSRPKKKSARVRVADHQPGKTHYFGQCVHVWVLTADGAALPEVCDLCGATCRRENLKITEYDATRREV